MDQNDIDSFIDAIIQSTEMKREIAIVRIDGKEYYTVGEKEQVNVGRIIYDNLHVNTRQIDYIFHTHPPTNTEIALSLGFDEEIVMRIDYTNTFPSGYDYLTVVDIREMLSMLNIRLDNAYVGSMEYISGNMYYTTFDITLAKEHYNEILQIVEKEDKAYMDFQQGNIGLVDLLDIYEKDITYTTRITNTVRMPLGNVNNDNIIPEEFTLWGEG